jgi:ubiquinone/menaquinone biosynthesis C-methylase UbiE
MDIFGFKTQGVNYDKFRPRYPQQFLSRYFALQGRQRYLDIATGTGQLLFALAPHWSYSRGVDISPTMIETAATKAKEFMQQHPDARVELRVGGVMELEEEEEKFDLITVGQALHFMPVEPALRKARGLLAEGGTLAVFGYILKTVKSSNPQEGEIFNRFYGKVKPLFTFDRDELHTHYSDPQRYPFQKVFSSVEREVLEWPLEMNKLEYLSYLKTMSGYNLYFQQQGEDPLLEVEQQAADEVTLLLDYFRIECRI